MARYKEWIERAKGSLEIAQIKIVGHIHYEVNKLCCSDKVSRRIR
jgi:hypothetical protein